MRGSPRPCEALVAASARRAARLHARRAGGRVEGGDDAATPSQGAAPPKGAPCGSQNGGGAKRRRRRGRSASETLGAVSASAATPSRRAGSRGACSRVQVEGISPAAMPRRATAPARRLEQSQRGPPPRRTTTSAPGGGAGATDAPAQQRTATARRTSRGRRWGHQKRGPSSQGAQPWKAPTAPRRQARRAPWRWAAAKARPGA